MNRSKHAFVVAGTQSGCGKTSITLALIAALRARELTVQPFKVGPDFIDPGFHTQLAGVESRNLDGWMLSREYNGALFRRLLSGADSAVVEGVMGLFDGYDGTGEAGSTAEMAKWLDLPVVLVVDARSMARSAAALVFGFSRFDPEVKLAGVIFNRIGGPGHLEYLKEAMSAALPDVAVLGGIPREDRICIPERHLGLVTSDEIRLDAQWRETAVRLLDRNVDLDLLLQNTVRTQEEADAAPEGLRGADNGERSERVVVAVARDAAFCFYYPDNLDLLRSAGAQIIFFSPLAGEFIPRGCAGVYLGGGYPEVYAAALSQLRAGGFLSQLKHAADGGMPVYAECGGLMTLSRFIDTLDGQRYPMAGILPFGTRMLGRRKALGYTEVVLRRSCLLGESGLRIRGHEFHYSEIVEQEADSGTELAYELQNRKHRTGGLEGYAKGSVLASYVHLHWGSAPEVAKNFVARCRDYMRKGK